MTTDLVWLAVLMFAVTYPWRAVPLLTPAMQRLPPRAFEYLRLVGPAILASLAAVNVLVVTPESGAPRLQVGVEVVAVLACIGIVFWRRNLLLGLIVAIFLVAGVRALTPG